MATHLKNLSDFNPSELPSAKGMRFALVVSSWNDRITGALAGGAVEVLKDLGCSSDDIVRVDVPGSYELPLGARWMADQQSFDAVICLGCVIQGETRHFDFICQAVATGLMDLNLEYGIPFIFGVLTPDTLEQAIDRAGGKHGNKGVEAATTAVRMVALRRSLSK
jgi:6,7-dimethyl-8-ribityllumazine synthase